jgi:hypothetical protein
LSPAYEAQILEQLQACDLEAALAAIQQSREP